MFCVQPRPGGPDARLPPADRDRIAFDYEISVNAAQPDVLAKHNGPMTQNGVTGR